MLKDDVVSYLRVVEGLEPIFEGRAEADMAAGVFFMQAGRHSESYSHWVLALPVLLRVVSAHPGYLSHSNNCRGAAPSPPSQPSPGVLFDTVG